MARPRGAEPRARATARRRAASEQRAARPEALPSAADTAGRLETARRLLDAVRALEEPYRSAIVLRFLEDEPLRGVARRTGVPVETARTRIRRGLARLRERLDPGDEDGRCDLFRALAPLAARRPVPDAITSTLFAMQAKHVLALAAAAVALVATVRLAAPALRAPERPHEPALGAALYLVATAPDRSAGLAPPAQQPEENARTATEARAQPAQPEPEDLEVVLRGRVVSERGAPVRGATVQVRTAARFDGFESWPTSDRRREFTVRRCPPGELLDVGVDWNGWPALRVYDVDPRDGPVELRIDVDEPTISITGTVADPSGEPLAGTTVVPGLEGEGGAPLLTTDASGGFALSRAPAGTWRVRVVRAQGYADRLLGPREILPGETWDTGEIRLQLGGTVRLVADSDDPELHFRLTSRDPEGIVNGWQSFPRAPSAGTYRIGPLEPGRWSIWVHGEGVARQVVPVDVFPEQESQVRVHVRPGHLRRLALVVEEPRSPRERFSVTISSSSGQVEHVMPTADREGRAAWTTWLEPGDYVVTATTKDGRSARRELAIGPVREPEPPVELVVRQDLPTLRELGYRGDVRQFISEFKLQSTRAVL